MARKRDVATPPPPLVPGDYDPSDAGVKVRIRGERGTYKVIERVRTERGIEWVTLFGGMSGHAQFRNVHPDRVVWAKPSGV